MDPSWDEIPMKPLGFSKETQVQQRLFSVTSEEAEAQDAQHSRAAEAWGVRQWGNPPLKLGDFDGKNMGKPSENVRLDGL
jgi:hypothetical protein